MRILTRRMGFVLALAVLLIAALPVLAQQPDAQVNEMASTLRMREYPSPLASIITELKGLTPLKVLGRTADTRWMKVETFEGVAGWVSRDYIKVFIPLQSIPVLDEQMPGTTPSTSTTAPAVEQPAQPPAAGTNARVIDMAYTLRLRTGPSALDTVIAELGGLTPLNAIGKSDNGEWLNVTTLDGRGGWVAVDYVDLFVALSELPVTGTAGVSIGTTTIPGVSSVRSVRDIYLRGQALGNNRNAFTKVGDSITTNIESYDAIGRGIYNLGAYGNLGVVISHFTSGGFNSFLNQSVASGPGWTTTAALDPRFANPAICKSLVSPIECEYDRNKPAVAIIQLGTNDLQYIGTGEFADNLSRIVDISIEKGVIPVLTTIPYRDGYDAKVDEFNAAIKRLASSRGVPLMDLKTAFDGLGNRGLSGDGIHPSLPAGGYADTANFASGEALQAGYTVRNLLVLQTLERVLASIGAQ